jgi:ammonia channel protein AmtB
MFQCANRQIVVAAGCDQFAPWAALVVGILSYFVYLVFVKILIKMRSIAHLYRVDSATLT